MTRKVLVLALMLATAALAAATAAAATGPVHVRPATGGPRSTFTVTVRIPAQTGSFSRLRRADTLTVTGPRRSGCISSAHVALPAAAAGATVTRRLIPRRLGGHWCRGTFSGAVVETQQVVCGPPMNLACPMIAIAPRTIGRFRFRVR